MKKLVTIALLCAMLLSCFVGCGSMQAGELDVDAYAADAGAQNVEFRTTLSSDADVWDGSTDRKWYDDNPNQTEYHIYTAAELRGLYDIQQKITGDSSCFEGVTIYLESDIDLDNRTWSAPSSTKYFAGTFDGQGHVIANWKQEVTGAGYQSFFGSVTGNACIKNLSMINATFTNALNKANKDTFSVVVTRATTVKDQTITISNIYTEADFVTKEGVTYTLSKAGALVGHVQGAGNLVVENCQNNNTVSSNGSRAAGIISVIENSKNVTVKNCQVTGSLASNGSSNGGIIGYLQTMTGSLLIEDCTVSASSISGKSQTAGILGATNVSKNITIKNCEVTSDITGTTQVAGILGQLAANRTTSGKTYGGSGGAIVVENCKVSGNLVGTTMSGGIIGYSDKKVTSLSITGCSFSGSLNAQRTSGGIMGTLNINTSKARIENCEVTGTLNFDLIDKKNNNAGGLIGKLHSNTMIDNCYVSAEINATYAPASGYASTDDVVSGAAGLIGRVYPGVTVDIANTEVGGSFTFNHEGNDDEFMFNVGHFIGSVGEEFSTTNAETGAVTVTPAAVVNFRENNSISAGTTFTCEGIDFAKNNAGTRPVILPVGYQTRDNDNGTYDLRFVFAMQANAFPAVGVKADLGFIYGDEPTFGQKVESVYAKTVYKTITDETGYVYAASDYGYSYLYTLVVTGVPADYTFEAETLQAIITPFGATKINGEVHTQNGGVMLLGDKKLDNNVAMGGFGVADLSPELDAEKYNENAIYVDANDFDTDLSWGVHTGVKAAAAECDGEYADGTLEIPTHVYLDSSIVVGDTRMMNITYNFEITEAGYYDMCIYFRLKGGDLNAKGDGDGSYNRGYLLSIDGAYGEEAIDFTVVEETSVADVKDASAGTYLDLWNETYFEVGTHTVTFSVGATGSYPHLRGLFFVKVAD